MAARRIFFIKHVKHNNKIIRGPCVRKLLTGLIMYIYPLKIKNIVLYCIV